MRFGKRLKVSWWVIGIVLIAVVVVWHLLKPGFIVSDDGDWMVIRLSAFFQSLREGQLPVRFLGRLNGSYGYPVANFLYPGFLYIGSFIHLAGFSFVDSVKLVMIGSVIGSALCIFYWLRNYVSVRSSFLGAVGFLLSPYLLFDIYTRGSVGEVLAVFAIAAALLCVEKGARFLVPFWVGLLIISHNSLAVLFFIFFIGYLLTKKKPEFFLPTLIGIGLATFFWFPALYERKFVVFDAITISQPQRYFAEGSNLFLLGLVNILAFLMVLKNSHKKREGMKIFFLVTFGLGAVLSTSLSSPFWILPFMGKLFQFPYRFLSLGLIAGPWIIAHAVNEVGEKNIWRSMFLFAALLFVSILPILSRVQFTKRPDGYYSTNEATTTVSNEYMPRWVKEAPKDRAGQRIVFYQGKGKIDTKTASTQKIDVILRTDEPSIMQINSIYYPGWGIAVDDQFVAPDYQNTYGLMRVPVPAGKHHLVAEFRETIPRFISDMTSIGAVIIYLGYIVWVKKNTKTN